MTAMNHPIGTTGRPCHVLRGAHDILACMTRSTTARDPSRYIPLALVFLTAAIIFCALLANRGIDPRQIQAQATQTAAAYTARAPLDATAIEATIQAADLAATQTIEVQIEQRATLVTWTPTSP